LDAHEEENTADEKKSPTDEGQFEASLGEIFAGHKKSLVRLVSEDFGNQ
jgi:hypothetical protein